MSWKNKYKKEFETNMKSNLEFEDIKGELIMKEKSNRGLKFALSFGVPVLALGAVTVMVLNNTNTPESSLSGSNTPTSNVTINTNTPKLNNVALAKSATPVVNSAMFTKPAINNNLRMAKAITATQLTDTEATIKDLLYQFDTIIANNNNYSTELVESDDENYLYKEIVSFKNLVNETTTYALYYNDITNSVEEDGDERESKSEYFGIAKYDDLTYKFRIELEEETETDETEISSKFTLYTSDTLKDYIEVESQSEVEGMESESEYSYKEYKNGNKVSEYELKIETEKDETEISLTMDEIEYSVTRVIVDDVEHFYVEAENDANDEEVEYEFIKCIVDDVVTYELVK